jgi:hypothetical protein
VRTRIVYVLALSALITACATTEFRAYEGRANAVEGQGGTRLTVDGMDIWDNGDPPRRFQVLGYINDERPGGLIPMARLKGDIVKKAREVGGDALVQVRTQSQLAGYYSSATATATTYGNRTTASGTGMTVPILRNSAMFAVIKYDVSPTPPPATSANGRSIAGYWEISFDGSDTGNCQAVQIEPNGRLSGQCRGSASPGTSVAMFSISGVVGADGDAILEATTGARISGKFLPGATGSGKWVNGSASGTWRAAKL